MEQFVSTRLHLNVFGVPCPNKLIVMIVYSKPVPSPQNRLLNVDHEFHSERPQRAKNVGFFSGRSNNFPTQETPFDSVRMFLTSAVVVNPCHPRFLSRNHRVHLAALTDLS